jgi:cytochrome c biogenesis protein CcmG/thiol:disulfide interchange protein DsbE
VNLMTDAKTISRRGVPLWVQILVWAFLVALLVLVGFGASRAYQGTVQPGDKTPDFSLTLFSGYEYNGQAEIKMSELRTKVVFINFWASWCKPCEQEAPILEEAWKYYQPRGKVVFLGVDYVDTEPEARVFLKKFANTYPNGPDVGTRISQTFRIKGVPETYIVDPDGVLRSVQIGPFTSVAEIQALIEPLLPK